MRSKEMKKSEVHKQEKGIQPEDLPDEVVRDQEPPPEIKEFEEHIDRCLSAVIHIEVVKDIAEVIKRVHSERILNR